MSRFYGMCMVVFSVIGLVAGCQEDPAAPSHPQLAEAWTPKYPGVQNCPPGTNPVHEVILHGETYSGYVSAGWLQYAPQTLPPPNYDDATHQDERTVEAEVYSLNGTDLASRCRNLTKLVTWTSYDTPSQVPIQNFYTSNGPQKAFFGWNGQPGNPLDNFNGHWEIARDRWVGSAGPKQLDDGRVTSGVRADTIVVDAFVQWPAICPPNTRSNCEP